MHQNRICVLLISGEKMLISADLKGCVTWFIHFLDPLWVRYNCAKFYHCRICMTDFREGGRLFHPPPHPWAAPKKPILNRVKIVAKILSLFPLFPFVLHNLIVIWALDDLMLPNNNLSFIINNVKGIQSLNFTRNSFKR